MPLLTTLEQQARTRLRSLVRDADELTSLTDAVRTIHAALSGHGPRRPNTATPTLPAPPQQLSNSTKRPTRQQRRTLEHQHRKSKRATDDSSQRKPLPRAS
jgi:hypothetical protein